MQNTFTLSKIHSPAVYHQMDTPQKQSTNLFIPEKVNHVTNKQSSSRRIFGLLIGIDDYQSSQIPPLAGAVADTEAFLAFFDTLNVPSKNLQVLHNASATRKAIIDALNRLKDDERIRPNDAIFIFFAGHGSELPPPPGWEAGGPGSMIQVIIPHDYCEIPGHEVQAIPDRTIGALLEGIAETKGNNIVSDLINFIRHDRFI